MNFLISRKTLLIALRRYQINDANSAQLWRNMFLNPLIKHHFAIAPIYTFGVIKA